MFAAAGRTVCVSETDLWEAAGMHKLIICLLFLSMCWAAALLREPGKIKTIKARCSEYGLCSMTTSGGFLYAYVNMVKLLITYLEKCLGSRIIYFRF